MSDIGVLVSESEGLSNSIIEYMASGLPVVATDVGGAKELIDEQNGVLIPVEDFEKLAEALLKILGDETLAESMKNHSLKKVKHSFELKNVMNQIHEFYQSL